MLIQIFYIFHTYLNRYQISYNTTFSLLPAKFGISLHPQYNVLFKHCIESCNSSYTELDSCCFYELCLVLNIIGGIYATHSMGAVRIEKYKEDNQISFMHAYMDIRYLSYLKKRYYEYRKSLKLNLKSPFLLKHTFFKNFDTQIHLFIMYTQKNCIKCGSIEKYA